MVYNHLPVAVNARTHGTEMPSSVIDLSGEWRFSLDREDRGTAEAWYAEPLPGDERIKLPGSLQAQGFGNDPGPETEWTGLLRDGEWDKEKYAPYRTEANFKMPFWLQPEKYYAGAAWYQKTVELPADWDGKDIGLTLERPHWETTVWVNDQRVGSRQYLSVPHVYELSEHLRPGTNTLTVRVDNRMVIDVGPNSHSVSDHTQSNWNGIAGELKLQARPLLNLANVQVHPDLDRNGIRVVADANGTAAGGELYLEVSFEGRTVASQRLDLRDLPSNGTVETFLPFEEAAQLWDEFQPNLYELSATIQSADSGASTHRLRFGMREITTEGTDILLNGQPIIFRGTLECAIFPLTGYPATDVESWKRIIRICKAHGLNHIRFHSWCPPKAAFEAADELGFYLQAESSTWPNSTTGLGLGHPIDAWLYEESDAVLEAYGNHPSFVLFASGNEPGGPERGAVYLRDWVPHYQAKEKRRLITSAAGWPKIAENDYHNFHQDARLQNWGAGLTSRINSEAPETVSDFSAIVAENPDHPVVVHENGQWCVYPNFDEIRKYTGVLKPKNFEIFRAFLEEKNLFDQAEDFLMASGKLQVLCYKEEIEANLRTDGYAGFQLLDMRDFPGQGTALIGMLDPFWDSKPYMTPEEFRRFCAPIVPLARMPKMTYTASERMTADIDVSQFGPVDLKEAKVGWSISDTRGQVLREGVLAVDSLPAGELSGVGAVAVDLKDFPVPAQFNLEVSVAGTEAVNDWDFWVYPDVVTVASEAVHVAETLDAAVMRRLEEGGKVLLLVDPKIVQTDLELGFSSIFWNTAWTRNQAPHTLGVLCDSEHPALAEFPTEYHSNWQWSLPIQHAATMELDALPQALKPIIQIVPDWFEPKKLALAFEAKVGTGKLLVCSIDLRGELDGQLERRQLKGSLLNYMESDQFDPQVPLSSEEVKSLFKDQINEGRQASL